jgi:outer membrane cobalamin receptor
MRRGIKARRFHDTLESNAVKADAGFTDVKWADQFLVGFMHSDLDKEIQHGPTMTVPFGEATYDQQVTMPNITYQRSDFIIRGLSANIFSSYSDLVRSRVDTTKNIYNWLGMIEGQRSLGGEQVRTLNKLMEKAWLTRVNFSYQINDKHKIGYNHLFHNLQRTDNDPLVTQKNEGYWAPQDYRKQSLGFVFQSALLGSRLNSSIFLKWYGYAAKIKTSETAAGIVYYNTVETNKSDPGYGIAASYRINPSFKLNGSYENAIRLPEPNELLGDGLNILSTAVLRPEQSQNFNLGFDLKILNKTKHEITLSGNVFYRDVTDLIQLYQYEPGAFININFDKVNMTGVDGST